MNTDNPGPADTSNWPTSTTGPQSCAANNSTTCAYDYGWGAAKVSFANAISAETTDGSASPTTAVTSANWWLDVETGNHWEVIESAYGPSTTSLNNDQSMLLGALGVPDQCRGEESRHLLDRPTVAYDHGHTAHGLCDHPRVDAGLPDVGGGGSRLRAGVL